MELSDRNYVILWTNRVRCTLNMKSLIYSTRRAFLERAVVVHYNCAHAHIVNEMADIALASPRREKQLSLSPYCEWLPEIFQALHRWHRVSQPQNWCSRAFQNLGVYIITPHAQREWGKVIGLGVLVYTCIYVIGSEKKGTSSKFSFLNKYNF